MKRLAPAALATMLLTACSSRVPADDLPGRYEAAYPFGSSTLLLNGDGTFVQAVTIAGQGSDTVRGTWKFDAARSVLSLHGALDVVNGYGELEHNWRTPTDLPFVGVERLWSRVNLETSAEYPYTKR